MMNDLNEINSSDSLLAIHYMPRPRIDKILNSATRSKLVYVIAGAGYGKTQAVRNYVEKHSDAVIRWTQFTENDNIGSHFWEHLTQNGTLDNPELALKLRELGFPDTFARFKQFAEILKNTEYRSHETFIVLDDFHLIHSEQVLTFLERYIHLQLPGVCVIIISRQEPELNAVSLFAKGKGYIVTENELCFSEDEISAFFKYRKIPFLPQNLPILFDATKGWPLAIQLFSLVLKRIPENFDLAINTMKQNVFKLMETEAFNNFPENVQKIMTQLALLSDLPLIPLQIFSNDASFMQNAPQLASFIWFDSLIGDYRIHPLYSEFLRNKQDILSHEEKQNTYRQAAIWCSENNLYMDTMHYLAKSQQFDRMLKTLLSYPFKLPYDTCEYFLNILEELSPNHEEHSDQNVLLLKNFFIPILLMGVGKYEEARERSFNVIRTWEHSNTPFAVNLLWASYSNLAYIDMYTCTVTHKYDAAEYLKKSVEYYKLSSIPLVKGVGPFSIADIRTFACLVGEGAELKEFDLFLEAAKKTAFYVEETFHDMYFGYENLVACEIAFYKNQSDLAKKYAHEAILKASEKKQYSIEAMAEHYLLRISLQEGDYLLAKKTLKQLRNHLNNPNFWNRQLLYDLTLGYFYAQTGLPDMSPNWLISNEKEVNSEIHSPVGELIVCIKNYIALKKYDQAFAVLCNSSPRTPHTKFLLGELIISLLTAAVRIKINDVSGAMEDFKRAYSLSFEGVFEIPFIELGKELHPLVATSSQQVNCGIPNEWLKKIDRKASIYAKKTRFIRESYKKEKNIQDTIQLSEREHEILNDLYHGLIRDEIAEARYLSIPTVKKIIESLYIKLNANNVADAIRIAMKNNLIIE